MPKTLDESLAMFDPVVADWFGERVGEPTAVQRLAWPEIARGAHVLVTAPTGSGKTLTAFLWALDRLLTGAWPGGSVRVLYVSPLKALNNDIRRNLLEPLAELEERFRRRTGQPPAVRVMTRSGDSTPAERRKMVRHPPEILITTPESLNILLASRGGRRMFSGLETVILDEIHAVAGGKRGTHLITAVDRLVPLCGEFQRVGLSATVRPLERVARFLGGYALDRSSGEAIYRPRQVVLVRAPQTKRYDLEVLFTLAAEPKSEGASLQDKTAIDEALDPTVPPEGLWDQLSRDLRRRVRKNRSTLIFANSRRSTEKITRLLNEGEPTELAYSHHGSLSREIRSVVEERLKEGRLAAIVATNSLELGIDIGALDEVHLLQTPPTIASAVQRIGRAGHGVGEVSRGKLFPLWGRDFLDAAVVARAVLEGEIEEVRPIDAPLDVLAQVILAMTVVESWSIDELFEQLRTSDPFHRLGRRQFDLVLEMLAGRYAESRVRELEPRVLIDKIDNTVRARRGSAFRIFLGGGTIPDRGYFHLRMAKTMARIGELDEEFVWERSLGDTFTLGAQSWRIQQITHNDVLVTPATKAAAMAPFWRAEERNRSFFLSEKVGCFLERAEAWLSTRGGAAELTESLETDHVMTPAAAAHLVDLLARQRAATGALPHRRRLIVESFTDPTAPAGAEQTLLHTFWGGRVNRPLAIALAAAWEERHESPIQIESDNDCLIVALPEPVEVDELLELVRPDNVERLLRGRLERTGFFGARFRENAGRALLLPRSDLRRRIPLWLSRERAKKLMQAVAGTSDFPIILETWRTCLVDEFEIEALKGVLTELAAGEISVSRVRTTSPSPFAAGLIWKQTNRLMYEDDTPESGASVSADLLSELVYSSQLRPRLPEDLLDRFRQKLQRVHPGYAPASPEELIDWVKERLLIPLGEWRELLAAVERDLPEVPIEDWLVAARERLVEIEQPSGPAVVALEMLPRLAAALGRELESRSLGAAASDTRTPTAPTVEAVETGLPALVAEWLRYYGPLDREEIADAFGLERQALAAALDELADGGTVVLDQFRDDGPVEICDAENLERLLRILRAASRSTLAARPLAELPLFLAYTQGLAGRRDGIDGLKSALEGLLAYPAAADVWESELLPARLEPYYPAWLDSLLQESDLQWLGCGRQRATFSFTDEIGLLSESGSDEAPHEAASEGVADLFPSPTGRYPFEELVGHGETDTAGASALLWEAVWRGEVTNTTMLALRRAIESGFAPPEPARPSAVRASRGRRSGPSFERWKATRPFAGDWFLIEPAAGVDDELDALDREELNKERVRLLLRRYGVVFRELLVRELPAFRWAPLFRTLRLMELSGEIVAGHFFESIGGLQFASSAALRVLREGLPRDVIYWLNAVDPAAPCGLGLDELKGSVPRRVPSTHLVYHGADLVLVGRRHGAELEISVPPEHPHLADYLGGLRNLLTREFRPRRSIDVETINDDPAAQSPYAAPIAACFEATREHRLLRLRRRY